MMFFDLDPEEERSFNSVVRHTVLEGPLTLFRCSDPQQGLQGGLGRYWMYASEVADALRDGRGYALIRELRERLAVSLDWGNMERAWLLRIPEGASCHAYWGLVQSQPVWSRRHQDKTGLRTERYYDGGSIQLVLHLGPAQRHWLHGPLHTTGLRAEDLR